MKKPMKELLTDRQVADILGWHVKTLQKNLRENRISLDCIQVSPRVRGFEPDEVKRFLDTRSLRHDGTGIKKRIRNWAKTSTRFLTDEEAQRFFAGVERDEEGVLISKEVGAGRHGSNR